MDARTATWVETNLQVGNYDRITREIINATDNQFSDPNLIVLAIKLCYSHREHFKRWNGIVGMVERHLDSLNINGKEEVEIYYERMVN